MSASRIFRAVPVTLLEPLPDIQIRVALPGKAETPRPERQYVEADLVMYYANSDAYRMKYRGFAVIRPNDRVQTYGYAVYPWQDGLLAVNQLALHPDDERDLECYVHYTGAPFNPAEAPGYGLRLRIDQDRALLSIRQVSPGALSQPGDLDLAALVPTDGGVIGRLAGLARRLAGWAVYDYRERRNSKRNHRG